MDLDLATFTFQGRTFEIRLYQDGPDYFFAGTTEILPDGKRETWDQFSPSADCIQDAFSGAVEDIVCLVDSESEAASRNESE